MAKRPSVKSCELRGGIQNIPDWCRRLYSSCGSAKHCSKLAKLWILSSTATFCGDCVKACQHFAPNFGENRSGCLTMTTPRLTLPSSPSSFWGNIIRILSPTHHTLLIWHPATSSYFHKWNWSWKDVGLMTLRRSRPNRRDCLTLTEKDFQEAFLKLRRRWDRCVRAWGYYFEGDGGR
jgi:hypothetical protein